MGKYNVTFNCGHIEVRELFGKVSERYNKIEWMSRNCMCSKCYADKVDADMADEFEKVEMRYAEYKRGYEDCKTVFNSYDPKKKTIVVYVPKS